jgi:hypothetical protein
MEPLISLQILNPNRILAPGDILRCETQLDAVEPAAVAAVEASVLWYTEGKGDEDLGVHFFERRVPHDVDDGNLCRLHRFQAILPNSPLTYDGDIVKIRWCARVRVFLRRGKDSFFERPFVLGGQNCRRPSEW